MSAAGIRRRHGNFVRPRRHNKYELRPRRSRLSPDTDRNSFRYSRECIPHEQWSARILGSKHVQIRRVLWYCLLVMLAMQCQPKSRAGRGSWVDGFFMLFICYLICFVYIHVCFSQVCDVSATSSARRSVPRTAVRFALLVVATWPRLPMGRIAFCFRMQHANAPQIK